MVSIGEAKPIEGVALNGLKPNQIEHLRTLLSQGVCPCDKTRSLLDCTQAPVCESARSLARFGVEKFKEGYSQDEVSHAVVQRYIVHHVSYGFDVEGCPSKGPLNAPIQLVEFIDFQCGFCVRMSEILTAVQHKFPTQVRIVVKQFPLPSHPLAAYSARAALAAHQQDRFWAFHDRLFKSQFSLSKNRIDQFAYEIGLDIDRYRVDRDSRSTIDMIERDKTEAIAANLRGTPALYINGRPYSGPKDVVSISQKIASLISESKLPRK